MKFKADESALSQNDKVSTSFSPLQLKRKRQETNLTQDYLLENQEYLGSSARRKLTDEEGEVLFTGNLLQNKENKLSLSNKPFLPFNQSTFKSQASHQESDSKSKANKSPFTQEPSDKQLQLLFTNQPSPFFKPITIQQNIRNTIQPAGQDQSNSTPQFGESFRSGYEEPLDDQHVTFKKVYQQSLRNSQKQYLSPIMGSQYKNMTHQLPETDQKSVRRCLSQIQQSKQEPDFLEKLFGADKPIGALNHERDSKISRVEEEKQQLDNVAEESKQRITDILIATSPIKNQTSNSTRRSNQKSNVIYLQPPRAPLNQHSISEGSNTFGSPSNSNKVINQSIKSHQDIHSSFQNSRIEEQASQLLEFQQQIATLQKSLQELQESKQQVQSCIQLDSSQVSLKIDELQDVIQTKDEQIASLQKVVESMQFSLTQLIEDLHKSKNPNPQITRFLR